MAQDRGIPFDSVIVGDEYRRGLPGSDAALPQSQMSDISIPKLQIIDHPAIRAEAPSHNSSQQDFGPQNLVQQDLGPQNSGPDALTIGAVNIRASSEMPTAPLAESYEEFIGQSADKTTLRALAASISAAARREGYLFASAQIPQQAVTMGVVDVSLDAGAIDEVRIIGSDNKRLRQILESLKTSAPQSEIVERQLLLAGDLPQITIEDSSYAREDGRGILIVKVKEDRARGYAAINNFGPSTLGPLRARITVDYAGVLFDDDILTANIISTFAQPRELAFVNARYARTLGNGATILGVTASAGKTRSGGRLSDFDLTGRSRSAGLFVNHALKRSRKFNLWLNGELSYLDVEQSISGQQYQNDELVTASLNFAGNYHIGIGRIYGGIGVTQGLGILGASGAGDPMNSRLDADGEFTKANIWVNSLLKFGGGFGARLAANGQISSDPLLAPEEISIGGPGFGRGYDFTERFGDEGILGLAELRKEFGNVTSWLDWFQLYGFVDGGYVNHIGDGFGDGSLASAGGGLRANIGPVNLDVQAAAPINSDRSESEDRSAKLLFQLGTSF